MVLCGIYGVTSTMKKTVGLCWLVLVVYRDSRQLASWAVCILAVAYFGIMSGQLSLSLSIVANTNLSNEKLPQCTCFSCGEYEETVLMVSIWSKHHELGQTTAEGGD